MLTVTYNRKDLEVRDNRTNRVQHVVPNVFVQLGGFAERIANNAIQNPGIPVVVDHKIRTNWRRVW